MSKPSPKTRLSDYFREVYIPDRGGDLRPKTIEQIKISVKRFDQFLERSATVNDLDQDTIQAFMAWYAGRAKPTTVNAKRKDLLALWRTAWDRHDTRKAPRRVRRLKEPKIEPRAYDIETMRKIIDHADALTGTVGRKGRDRWTIERRLWWRALLTAQYSTAARIDALRATKTRNCDLGRRTLYLPAHTQKQNADQTFKLIPEAVEAIGPIYDPRREDLFYWPYGRRHFFGYYRKHFLEPLGLVAEGGMQATHKIRRTTISHVAAQSEDQAIKIAGHANPQTTRSRYFDHLIVNPEGASQFIPSLSDEPQPDPEGPDILSLDDYRAG